VRFLLDQSADARLVGELQARGHDATRVGRDYPGGLRDDEVLRLAVREDRILVTDDRDFGELVFKRGHSHRGVIFLRLGEHADLTVKRERLEYVLDHVADRLDQFLVVTRHRVRTRSQ
jgi:predicted nuclease of predicted toxin-antitoxin system